jgi:hypothetical protein
MELLSKQLRFALGEMAWLLLVVAAMINAYTFSTRHQELVLLRLVWLHKSPH